MPIEFCEPESDRFGVAERIFIVIPVFNGWEQTRRCLSALREGRATNVQTIIVDHGSTDDTKMSLPRQFPEVKIVLGDESLWWAGATNLGIRAALTENATAVILLNNDSYVDEGTIQRLLSHHMKKPQAIVAARQRAPDGRDHEIERVTSCLLLGFSTMRLPRFLARKLAVDGLWQVDMIFGGRGTVVPTEVLRRVGLFDEELLPHYGADHDFYWRCHDMEVPLYVATDAWVIVDPARTSMAETSTPKNMTDLRKLLLDRRSHRNIAAQKAMFQKHYPVRSLYWVGLGLFMLRYLILIILGNLRAGRFGDRKSSQSSP